MSSSRRNLFETRDGKPFWRCLRCGSERDAMFPGSFVSVANDAIGIVCEAECGAAAVEIVRVAFRSARRFHDDPEKPLVRGEATFSRSRWVLEAELPPGFEGTMGGQAQSIFRPLAAELFGEGWMASLGKKFFSSPVREIRLEDPKALGVGDWLRIRVFNPSKERKWCRVELRGHCGEPHDEAKPVREVGATVVLEPDEDFRAGSELLPGDDAALEAAFAAPSPTASKKDPPS